jgi:hypothetical protein
VLRPTIASCALALLLLGCVDASRLATPAAPTAASVLLEHCDQAERARPFVVDWASSDRADLHEVETRGVPCIESHSSRDPLLHSSSPACWPMRSSRLWHAATPPLPTLNRRVPRSSPRRPSEAVELVAVVVK